MQANADAQASYLCWFANGQFIGNNDLSDMSNHTPLIWQAKTGDYEVQVSDDLGRSSSISVQVQAVK
ncbi:hypothetical protein [Brumicola pallidula]|uniref:hypothetical protein n=1 Tax=Brumicola pallidula TaxID=56807 RepID=UPI003F726FD4